jgi:hypothetical protein
MLGEIHTYEELRVRVREALQRQHPEWVDANGTSRLCDYYEARFAEVACRIARERAAASEQTMNTIWNREG